MSDQSRFKQALRNKIHAYQSLKANMQFGFPFRKLKLIGVTGTNGKTTATQMIYHILKENGLKVGYLSTISAKIGDKDLDTGLHVTTPDPWDVPRYLKMMLDAGIEYVVVESTSQGLVQNRLWGLKFEAATITNIQSDHLDYHGSWENYAQAKFLLIKKLVKGGLAVLNQDDNKSAEWIKTQLSRIRTPLEIVWCSKTELSGVKKSFAGYEFEYKGQHFKMPLLGDYNLENAIEAITVCNKYLPFEKISNALATFPVPVGRMELIQQTPFVVIVDFAHTPDALTAALNSVLALKQKGSRLITVFGCAGKRDHDRRKMGAVSAKLSDVTILTAEDPRDEKLADVNHEILAYGETEGAKSVNEFAEHSAWEAAEIPALKNTVESILSEGRKPFILFNEDSVSSRMDALDCALRLARPGDIVFTTGKAHEQSLAFGANQTEYPWDERSVVKNLLNNGK